MTTTDTAPTGAPTIFHGSNAPWNQMSYEANGLEDLGARRIVPGDEGAVAECISFIAGQAAHGYEEVMGTLDDFGDRLRALEAYGPMLLRIAASEAADKGVPERLDRLEDLLRTHAWYIDDRLDCPLEPGGIPTPEPLVRPRDEVIPGVDEMLDRAYPGPSLAPQRDAAIEEDVPGQPSRELRGLYGQMTATLARLEDILEPVVIVAERADALLNSETDHLADLSCGEASLPMSRFEEAAGNNAMFLILIRVCEQLRAFHPGCVLP